MFSAKSAISLVIAIHLIAWLARGPSEFLSQLSDTKRAGVMADIASPSRAAMKNNKFPDTAELLEFQLGDRSTDEIFL